MQDNVRVQAEHTDVLAVSSITTQYGTSSGQSLFISLPLHPDSIGMISTLPTPGGTSAGITGAGVGDDVGADVGGAVGDDVGRRVVGFCNILH